MGHSRILLICFSVCVAALCYYSAAAFLVAVFGVCVYAVSRTVPAEDRRLVVTVLVVAFLVRAILAVGLHAANFLKGYHGISGDDLLYTVKSLAIAWRWEGKPYGWVADLAGGSIKFGTNPYSYLVAAYYALFGFHPVAAKLINGILGAFIGWFAYLAAREMFDARAARIALVAVSFYPSLIRWSVANLKDPLIIAIFMVSVYFLIITVRRRIKVWQLMAFSAGLYVMSFFTPVLYAILLAGGAALAAGLRVVSAIRPWRLRAVIVLLALLAAGAGLWYVMQSDPAPLITVLYRCEEQQGMIARADYSGYRLYPARFMACLNAGVVPPAMLAAVAFRGAVNFMLTPFPWQLTTPERLLSLPQMLVWYMALFFALLGFFRLAARQPGVALLVGCVVCTGIVASSLAEGNIGAAFRHRDVFSPFFIICASAAAGELWRKEARA